MDLYPDTEDHEEYSELLVSYGSQLKATDWMWMDHALIQRVAAVCSNVRGCLVLLRPIEPMHVRDMGDCMRHVDIGRCWPGDESDLSIAMSACRSVEDIILAWNIGYENVAAAVVRALHLDWKPLLRSLHLRFCQTCDVTDALRCIGQAAGELRSFKVGCSPQEKAGWEAVASASPLLEDVQIRLIFEVHGEGMELYHGSVAEEDDVVNIVSSLSQCPSLRLLVVSDFREKERVHRKAASVDDACIPLRYHRGIVPHVSILGVDYIA